MRRPAFTNSLLILAIIAATVVSARLQAQDAAADWQASLSNTLNELAIKWLAGYSVVIDERDIKGQISAERLEQQFAVSIDELTVQDDSVHLKFRLSLPAKIDGEARVDEQMVPVIAQVTLHAQLAATARLDMREELVFVAPQLDDLQLKLAIQSLSPATLDAAKKQLVAIANLALGANNLKIMDQLNQKLAEQRLKLPIQSLTTAEGSASPLKFVLSTLIKQELSKHDSEAQAKVSEADNTKFKWWLEDPSQNVSVDLQRFQIDKDGKLTFAATARSRVKAWGWGKIKYIAEGDIRANADATLTLAISAQLAGSQLENVQIANLAFKLNNIRWNNDLADLLRKPLEAVINQAIAERSDSFRIELIKALEDVRW